MFLFSRFGVVFVYQRATIVAAAAAAAIGLCVSVVWCLCVRVMYRINMFAVDHLLNMPVCVFLPSLFTSRSSSILGKSHELGTA